MYVVESGGKWGVNPTSGVRMCSWGNTSMRWTAKGACLFR